MGCNPYENIAIPIPILKSTLKPNTTYILQTDQSFHTLSDLSLNQQSRCRHCCPCRAPPVFLHAHSSLVLSCLRAARPRGFDCFVVSLYPVYLCVCHRDKSTSIILFFGFRGCASCLLRSSGEMSSMFVPRSRSRSRSFDSSVSVSAAFVVAVLDD